MRSDRVLERVENLPRLAVARALREHPEWTLENVLEVIERGGPRAAALGQLTIAELVDLCGDPIEARPHIDHARRWRAMQLQGADFDQLVLEALREAPGEVAASYIRARLGGPRWKLQASFHRLIAAGRIERTGNTSGVRYTATELS
jgi:hypothetical protein